MKNLGILAIAFLFFLLPLTVTWAKPAPPKGWADVFEKLSEFEESFQHGKLTEALEIIAEIDEKLAEVLSNVDEKEKMEFASNFKALKQFVETGNAKGTEKQYILLQRKLFIFIDQFHFDDHPLLSVINQCITVEASESAEKGDYEEVAIEMQEVGGLIKQARQVLQEKGVSVKEIHDLRTDIQIVIRAAQEKKSEKLNQALTDLKMDFKSFMERSK